MPFRIMERRCHRIRCDLRFASPSFSLHHVRCPLYSLKSWISSFKMLFHLTWIVWAILKHQRTFFCVTLGRNVFVPCASSRVTWSQMWRQLALPVKSSKSRERERVAAFISIKRQRNSSINYLQRVAFVLSSESVKSLVTPQTICSLRNCWFHFICDRHLLLVECAKDTLLHLKS